MAGDWVVIGDDVGLDGWGDQLGLSKGGDSLGVQIPSTHSRLAVYHRARVGV